MSGGSSEVGFYDRAASKMAQEALHAAIEAQRSAATANTTAATAQALIAQHEITCSARWSRLFMVNILILGSLLSVLGVLLYDKFF